MKTIILYATKNGAVKQIAQSIADKMEGAQIYDLAQDGIPNISQFDCVIIGSSIYAGAIRKEAKTFIQTHTIELCQKRLGLFLSGMDDKSEKTYFDTNFSADLLQASVSHAFLGGIFDPKKAGMMGRFIMKAVTKQSDYTDNIMNERIESFVAEMLP